MIIKLKKFLDLTRFAQTLFGLPLIAVASVLAFFEGEGQIAKKGLCMILIMPSFIAARVAGMCFNQYWDRHIDAINPRTKERCLPSGRVKSQTALLTACFSLLLFLSFTLLMNRICFLISCFSATLLILYSFMKRIHYSCHLVLGLIHFMGPLTAYVALKGSLSLPIIFLSLSGFFLNAGNDILYALQDYDFDCAHHLKSIPSRFGIDRSIKIAALLQGLCVTSLVLFGYFSHFPLFYYLSPLIACFSFLFFHKWRKNPKNFFRTNVSITVSTAVISIMACIPKQVQKWDLSNAKAPTIERW